MAQKKRGDYLAKPIQMLAYQLGLVSNPDPDKVRKMAYGSVAPSRKPPVPPEKRGLPDRRMKSDFQAAAATAFNTEVKANPKPKNPNEGIGKPLRGRGNPKTVNSSQAAKARVPARGEARGGMKSTLESYRASKAAKASVSMAGGGPDKRQGSSSPSMAAKAKDFKQKNLSANQKVGKKKDEPAASVKRKTLTAPKPMTFQTAVRRNEAESYTRNKMRPKGNLLDLIRRKK